MVATKTDGTLWTWGNNEKGQLGQNQASAQLEQTSSPVQIPGTDWGTDFKDIQVSASRTMVVKTNGTLWAWGSNDGGQLGLNSKTNYSSPVQVGSDTSWYKMGGMSQAILALKQV